MLKCMLLALGVGFVSVLSGITHPRFIPPCLPLLECPVLQPRYLLAWNALLEAGLMMLHSL